MKQTYDLVIRGGEILDGSGGAPFRADVAVQDGRIAMIGSVAGRGTEEIDATGRFVTPGFVDVHTHYDGQATWDHFLAPSCLHGTTTVVMGNCGVGFAPVRPTDHDRIIELMEGVEDIPGTALHEGLSWNWSSFPEYLDALEAKPRDIDICAQVPHGALRLYVMGERAMRHEVATAEDIAAMRAIVAEAIKAGAFGVSTSRTTAHRSSKGELTPSIVAAENELLGLALGMRDAGAGVLEGISDWEDERVHDFGIFRRVVEQTGVPCSLSLMQDPTKPQHWRSVLTQLEEARADGLPMIGQVAPRAVGLVVSLESSVSPLDCPAWQEIRNLPLEQLLSTMREPAFRARMLAEAEAIDRDPPPDRKPSASRDFEQVYPLGSPVNYEPETSHSVADLARAKGISAYACCYDLLTSGDGTAILYVPLFNFVDGNYDVCREMLSSNATMPGLGDAGAHVGTICDASFSTFLLTHWGRDRLRGRFEPGWLIKRLTADTARWMGLTDRGLLAPGLKADINVIDFDRLQVEPPRMVADLPAGGRRFLQGAQGYDATIVSGVVIRRDGEPTGATPGRLLRQKCAGAGA